MIGLWNTNQFLFSPMTGMSNYCINHHSRPLTRAAQMPPNLATDASDIDSTYHEHKYS